MAELAHNFLYCFIPLFVAIDVFGLLPVYVSLVEGLTGGQRERIIVHSLSTALAVSVVFILLGNEIFKVLSITVSDFQIAGGLVLLAFGIIDLVAEGKKQRPPADTMGIVPLGVPLIIGPAVLSITLFLLQQYGLPMTVLALFINLLIVAFVFSNAIWLLKILGKGGSLALSKLVMLLLVAIAVKMIRAGIIELLVRH